MFYRYKEDLQLSLMCLHEMPLVKGLFLNLRRNSGQKEHFKYKRELSGRSQRSEITITKFKGTLFFKYQEADLRIIGDPHSGTTFLGFKEVMDMKLFFCPFSEIALFWITFLFYFFETNPSVIKQYFLSPSTTRLEFLNSVRGSELQIISMWCQAPSWLITRD